MENPDSKYKHKPSEKHTLEEVLKSLHDLIRNDLADGANAAHPQTPDSLAPDKSASGTRESKFSREEKTNLREDFASVSPAAGPVNLDAVMRSLKDLIGNELNVGDDSRAADTATPSSKHDEYLSLNENLEEYLPQEFSTPEKEFTSDEAAQPEVALPPSPDPEPAEDVSLEMPDESESQTLKAADSPKEDLTPGTQRELFFDETPSPQAGADEIIMQASIEAAPEASSTDISMEETPALTTEESANNTDTFLPTIDVEESFNEADFPATGDLSMENPPPRTEEIVALDVGMPDETGAPPQKLEPQEPLATEEKENIVLEIVDEPYSGDKVAADFDALGATEAASETSSPSLAIESGGNIPPETGPETGTTVDMESPPPTEPPLTTGSAFSLDDIPVLNEVVAPPAGSMLPADPHTAPPEPLPSPDRARDIVVRAVAKLNIEMRKSGSAGLDTRTILRLQQLIRQELEKVGEK